MAEPGNTPRSLDEAIVQAQDLLQTEWVAKVPGLSIAVACDGVTVWNRQYGFADLTTQEPVTPASRFRIASVSKPLTAAGLALLVERGLLDLDAPVQQYIPDFPKKDGVITPRLLAGHLTGIRNYRGTEAVSNQPFPNLRAGLKIFENDPLESAPGTKFSYSSYNWNVLGVVMEAASGQDFVDYMNGSVIKPLGLIDTLPDLSGVADPQRTQFYETGPDGKFFPAPITNHSYKWPSGGYFSTAADLIRLGNAHLEPGFLKAESLRLLYTSLKTTDGKPTHYGIGWFVGRDIVYHTGGTFGGTAILLLRPAARIVVAIISNGSQLMLQNAILRGKVPRDASRFTFRPDTLAHQIARMFAGINPNS